MNAQLGLLEWLSAERTAYVRRSIVEDEACLVFVAQVLFDVVAGGLVRDVTLLEVTARDIFDFDQVYA